MFFGVLEGIVVAIVLSVLLFFRRNWWPHGAVLGDRSTASTVAQRRATIPTRRSFPASSCTDGRRRCSSPTPARSASRSAASSANASPRWIVLQCEAITDIDVTAAEMLEQLDVELNAAGVHLAFVEMRSRLQDLVDATACSRPSTATTSTPPSTKRSPRYEPSAPTTATARSRSAVRESSQAEV